MNYNYDDVLHTNPKHDEMLNDILEQIIPDSELRHYVLKQIASSIISK